MGHYDDQREADDNKMREVTSRLQKSCNHTFTVNECDMNGVTLSVRCIKCAFINVLTFQSKKGNV